MVYFIDVCVNECALCVSVWPSLSLVFWILFSSVECCFTRNLLHSILFSIVFISFLSLGLDQSFRWVVSIRMTATNCKCPCKQIIFQTLWSIVMQYFMSFFFSSWTESTTAQIVVKCGWLTSLLLAINPSKWVIHLHGLPIIEQNR